MITQVYTEMEGQCGNKVFDRSEFEGVCRWSSILQKWVIKTSFELQGRGIKKYDSAFRNEKMVFDYMVTSRAFEVLSKEMNLLQEMLLD